MKNSLPDPYANHIYKHMHSNDFQEFRLKQRSGGPVGSKEAVPRETPVEITQVTGVTSTNNERKSFNSLSVMRQKSP